jgi:hypothetical protein
MLRRTEEGEVSQVERNQEFSSKLIMLRCFLDIQLEMWTRKFDIRILSLGLIQAGAIVESFSEYIWFLKLSN